MKLMLIGFAVVLIISVTPVFTGEELKEENQLEVHNAGQEDERDDDCKGIKLGGPCTDSCACCGKTVFCAYHEEGHDRVFTCKDKGFWGGFHNAFYYLSCVKK